jgi:uncharacterized oxidoreductase
MKTAGNTVLITGGATGIGLALAESLLHTGNTVIVCGRRESKLLQAQKRLPGLHTRVCDVSVEKERKSLFEWVSKRFGNLNVLINNAGIQRAIDFKSGARGLRGKGNEIDINLVAPLALCARFVPLLLKCRESAVVNVSSGLGFVPIASMPVYCATKAAVHLFTVSLRHQLKSTPVKVFEIIPPMVDTELGKGTTEENEGGYRGIKPSQLAAEVMAALAKDQYEIGVGQAKDLVAAASRKNFDEIFQRMNSW